MCTKVLCTRKLDYTKDIACMLFIEQSDNREELWCAGRDGYIYVRDARSGKLLRKTASGSDVIHQLLRVGKEVWAACNDAIIRSWSAEDGMLSGAAGGHTASVLSLAHHEHLVYSGSADGTIRVWDPRSKECLRTIQIGKRVRCMQSLNGKLFLGDDEHNVSVWAHELKGVRGIGTHAQAVTALCAVSDSNEIWSASKDRVIRVWDATSLTLKRELKQHSAPILAMVSNLGYVWSASSDRTVRVWLPLTGACIHTIDSREGWINALCTTPTGVWSAGSHKVLRFFTSPDQIRRLESITISNNLREEEDEEVEPLAEEELKAPDYIPPPTLVQQQRAILQGSRSMRESTPLHWGTPAGARTSSRPPAFPRSASLTRPRSRQQLSMSYEAPRSAPRPSSASSHHHNDLSTMSMPAQHYREPPSSVGVSPIAPVANMSVELDSHTVDVYRSVQNTLSRCMDQLQVFQESAVLRRAELSALQDAVFASNEWIQQHGRSETAFVSLMFPVSVDQISESSANYMIALLSVFYRCVREQLQQWQGFEVKLEGGLFIVGFANVSSAVSFAAAVLLQLRTVSWPATEFSNFPKHSVSIGVAYGLSNHSIDDGTSRKCYYGGACDLALALSQIASVGQILTDAKTWAAAQQVYPKSNPAQLVFTHLGMCTFAEGDSLGIVQIAPASVSHEQFPSIPSHTDISLSQVDPKPWFHTELTSGTVSEIMSRVTESRNQLRNIEQECVYQLACEGCATLTMELRDAQRTIKTLPVSLDRLSQYESRGTQQAQELELLRAENAALRKELSDSQSKQQDTENQLCALMIENSLVVSAPPVKPTVRVIEIPSRSAPTTVVDPRQQEIIDQQKAQIRLLQSQLAQQQEKCALLKQENERLSSLSHKQQQQQELTFVNSAETTSSLSLPVFASLPIPTMTDDNGTQTDPLPEPQLENHKVPHQSEPPVSVMKQEAEVVVLEESERQALESQIHNLQRQQGKFATVNAERLRDLARITKERDALLQQVEMLKGHSSTTETADLKLEVEQFRLQMAELQRRLQEATAVNNGDLPRTMSTDSVKKNSLAGIIKKAETHARSLRQLSQLVRAGKEDYDTFKHLVLTVIGEEHEQRVRVENAANLVGDQLTMVTDSYESETSAATQITALLVSM